MKKQVELLTIATQSLQNEIDQELKNEDPSLEVAKGILNEVLYGTENDKDDTTSS